MSSIMQEKYQSRPS